MIEEITRNLSESTATSVDAYLATWITLILIAFLLIVVPLLERIPVLKDCVSRRWVVVSVTTTLMVSVVVNFHHLSDSVRGAIVIGGFIVGIVYILIRSVEGWLANGWTFGVKRIEGDWQNKRVEVEMDPAPPQDTSQSQEHTQEHSQSQEHDSEKSEDKRDAI